VSDTREAVVTHVRLLMMASGSYTLEQVDRAAPGLADELLEIVVEGCAKAVDAVAELSVNPDAKAAYVYSASVVRAVKKSAE
jgi:hypothetical protein